VCVCVCVNVRVYAYVFRVHGRLIRSVGWLNPWLGSNLGSLNFMALMLSCKPPSQLREIWLLLVRCGYNQQGALANSPSPTDGVLGLSSSSVSLPSQLSRQGLIKNIIAHCLVPGVSARSGYLLLGEKLIPSHGITWAPFVKKPSMYNIWLFTLKLLA
jgi:hypothetical protein